MKHLLYQIWLVIVGLLTLVVLYNPDAFSCLMGRAVLVSAVILMTQYNVYFGIALVVVIAYMYIVNEPYIIMEGFYGSGNNPNANNGSSTGTGTNFGTSTVVKEPVSKSEKEKPVEPLPITSTSTMTKKSKDANTSANTSANNSANGSFDTPVNALKTDKSSPVASFNANTSDNATTSPSIPDTSTSTPAVATVEQFKNKHDRISVENHLRPKLHKNVVVGYNMNLDALDIGAVEYEPYASDFGLNYSII